MTAARAADGTLDTGSGLPAEMVVIIAASERAGYRSEFLKLMALTCRLVLINIVIASSYPHLRYL